MASVPLAGACVYYNSPAPASDPTTIFRNELLAAARRQPANVDETSLGCRCWLWVMVTAVATVFQIASGRNRAALRALVGTDYRRVLTSDRHSIYSHLAEDARSCIYLIPLNCTVASRR